VAAAAITLGCGGESANSTSGASSGGTGDAPDTLMTSIDEVTHDALALDPKVRRRR
jgi:hypothetical protein